ncbi:MAG: hypothetical protein EOP45_09280 [Sphingobacteriaceae bacterium]|nr:MAG: hypothetical protein EOP45_09280 [Sphingobacteriaceae bacterium]
MNRLYEHPLLKMFIEKSMVHMKPYDIPKSKKKLIATELFYDLANGMTPDEIMHTLERPLKWDKIIVRYMSI